MVPFRSNPRCCVEIREAGGQLSQVSRRFGSFFLTSRKAQTGLNRIRGNPSQTYARIHPAMVARWGKLFAWNGATAVEFSSPDATRKTEEYSFDLFNATLLDSSAIR